MVEPTPSSTSSRPKRTSAAAGASALSRQAQDDDEDSDVPSEEDGSSSPSSSGRRPRPNDSPQKPVKKGRASYGGSGRKARGKKAKKGKQREEEAEDEEDGPPSSVESIDTDPVVLISPMPKRRKFSTTRKRSSPSPSLPAGPVRRAPAAFTLDFFSSSQPQPQPQPPSSSLPTTTSRSKRALDPPPAPSTSSSSKPVKKPPAASRTKSRASASSKRSFSDDDSDDLPPSLPPSSRSRQPRLPASPKRKAAPNEDDYISSPAKKLASSKLSSSSKAPTKKKSNVNIAPPPSSQSSTTLSSSLVGPSRSFLGSQGGASKVAVVKETKWSLRDLKKVVWVRLDAEGGVRAEEEEDGGKGSFWWPALRETSDRELNKESCAVRLFQRKMDAKGRPLGSPIIIRNLSSSNITNLFTGLPRTYKFNFATFSQPATEPSPSQPQPSSSSATLPLTLSSVDKPLFDSILKLAHKEMDVIEAEDLYSDDALSAEEEDAEERAARKGKAKEESMAEILAARKRNGAGEVEEKKKTYMQEANEAALARRGGRGGEVSDDEPDGPEFSPNDKEKSRVFVLNEHAWWGALITGPGKKNPRGDWLYSCRLVHGKVLKAVREDKIVARDQLPLIHRAAWGTYKSQLAPIPSSSLDDPLPTFQHARSRPSTPEPSSSSSRPFEDLTMWEQLVRCRPTLERIIKGEYPPAVKAHREATSAGGLRLNMARDAVGYGALTDKEVEEAVLPELQRWALRNQGPEVVRVEGENGTERMSRPPRPTGDEAYERLSETSREKYVAGFLLQQALIELVVLEHGLRDAPLPAAAAPPSPPPPPPAPPPAGWVPLALEPSPAPEDVAPEEVSAPAPVEVAPVEEDASLIVLAAPSEPEPMVVDDEEQPPPSVSIVPSQPDPEPQPSLPSPSSNSQPEASTSTSNVVLDAASLPPLARTPSPAPSDDPINTHSQLDSPTYNPSIQYRSLLSHFPPSSASHPPPTSSQLTLASDEIKIYKTALALFQAEEPTDPFWWVRPEYSYRLQSLEAGLRRKRKAGEEGREEEKTVQDARKQCREMDIGGGGIGGEDEGEGWSDEDGGDGEGGGEAEGGRSLRRRRTVSVTVKKEEEEEKAGKGKGKGKGRGSGKGKGRK
ncbi:hypothetical protein BDY24DRAFT_104676 [Mrakia frigida]|uniref:uncharacterized protein n=1 Tax=Mrakia frigida TaxID=29902 RepID=UPI003FCBF87B